MKKPLYLTVITILVAFHVSAQTKGMLSLSLGPALPLGEYSSKSASDPSSGTANLGPLADLSYRHSFGASRFGWMATLRYRFNGIDKNATIAPFASEFPGYSWTMDHSRWSTAAALGGGYYELPVTPKLSVSAMVEVGVAESWSPKQSITGVRDSVGFGPVDLVEAHLHSVSATSFIALAALGARYQWRRRWFFVARLDYTYLKPTFNNLTAILDQAQHLVIPGLISLASATTVEVSSYTRNYTQPMPSLNVTVGLCRQL